MNQLKFINYKCKFIRNLKSIPRFSIFVYNMYVYICMVVETSNHKVMITFVELKYFILLIS